MRNLAEHNQSLEHRRTMAPTVRTTKAARARKEGRSDGRGRWSSRRSVQSGDDYESVRKHRRREPNDGPRFLVKVRQYWRQLSYRERAARYARGYWKPKRRHK